MWSRAFRAASRAVDSRASATTTERTPFVVVAPASTPTSATVADADADDRASGRPASTASGARDWLAIRASNARANFAHLIPGALALCACACVLVLGSMFVEHPIWVFEHKARAKRAEMRSGDVAGAMTCEFPSDDVGHSCMPSFAVIGAHVSAVSELKTLMAQHDMIGGGQKTLHFFNPVYGAAQGVQMCEPSRGLLSAYFSAVDAREKDARSAIKDGEAYARESGDVATGDWSDTYFTCACCATTMKSLMPKLRPIVVLRDPVGRAMARYTEENHPRGTPMEAGGLSACALKENDYSWADTAMKTKAFLEDCLREADGASAQIVARECLDFHSMLGWSMYAEYLEIWLEQFPDTLVLYADDIAENPAEVAAAVERYLGLPPKRGPYDTSEIATRADTGVKSISFDSQKSLLETNDDVHATEVLIEMFEPHVKRLHKMSTHGKIPPLPYKWLRRYSIPVEHEISVKTKRARKLLALNDDFISTIVDDLNRVNEEFETAAAAAAEKARTAATVDKSKQDKATPPKIDGKNVTTPDQLVATVEMASDHKLLAVQPIIQVTSGASSSKKADGLGDIVYKSEELQRLAEAEESAKKGPTWKSDSVRGRFYSDLYVKMDEDVRDELKGKLFVPVTVPYLFQFANEFKQDHIWMNIVGISKAEQDRVYHELWREDCTHSQQWSAEDGCCGLSCCFVGGHRKENVGLRG